MRKMTGAPKILEPELTSVRVIQHVILFLDVRIVLVLVNPIIEIQISEECIAQVHVHCSSRVEIRVLARPICVLGIPGESLQTKTILAFRVCVCIGIWRAVDINPDLQRGGGNLPSLPKGFGIVKHRLDFGLILF